MALFFTLFSNNIGYLRWYIQLCTGLYIFRTFESFLNIIGYLYQARFCTALHFRLFPLFMRCVFNFDSMFGRLSAMNSDFEESLGCEEVNEALPSGDRTHRSVPVSNGLVSWRKKGNRWENLELTDLLYGEPGDKLLSQAERVIFKFGSGYRLAKFVREATGRKMTDSLVQKWTYSKSRGGTGGVIPTRAWPFIIEAAEYAGVVLEISDFDPRPKKVDLSKMVAPTCTKTRPKFTKPEL